MGQVERAGKSHLRAALSSTRSRRTFVYLIRARRAKRYAITDDTRITFADVAGIDEIEAELLDIVDFLPEPEKYQRLDGRIPIKHNASRITRLPVRKRPIHSSQLW